MNRNNFIKTAWTIMLLCIGINGCKKDNDVKIIAITVREAVYVGASTSMELSLKDNVTLQLTPFIMPKNATNQAIEYSTATPEMLDINASGLLTPKSVGAGSVTVSATDGSGVKVTYKVNIIDHFVKATAINVTAAGSNISLKVGGSTFDLGAQVTLSPADTWDKTVTYKSNNEAYVTVSSSGIVTPVGVGSTTITITTADGSNISRDVNVTVLDYVQMFNDFPRAGWTVTVQTATGYEYAADAITGAAGTWAWTQGMPSLLLDGSMTSYFMIVKPGKAYPYSRAEFPLADIPTQASNFMPSFTVDMKTPQKFNYLIWVHRQFNNRSQWYGCRVYGSNDNTNWTQIRSNENEVAGSDIFWIPQIRGYVDDMGSPFDNRTLKLSLNESTYRYVKIELAMWSDIYNSQHPAWPGAGSTSGLTINIGEFGLGYSWWE